MPLIPIEIEVKPRHKCPFYGFSSLGGVLIDTRGNQCALVQDAHSPCLMEIGGDVPNWDNCPSFRPSLVKYLANGGLRVFPQEAGPSGVTFENWAAHVMSDDLPRPAREA